MPLLVHLPRRWLAGRRRHGALLGTTLTTLTLVLLLAAPAYADSPFDDPAYQRPAGGGTAGSAASRGTPGDAALPALPDGYRELPPPLISAARPSSDGADGLALPLRQTPETNPNNPLAWISLGLNPGKWLLDSVLGATTGIIYSLASVFEVLGRFGNGQIVDLSGSISSASDTAFNMLFTTPESLTISWPGAAGLGSPLALHNIMRQVALSLLVVLCTYRALFVLAGRSFRDGLVELLLAFIGGVAGIQGAWWFCSLFVRAGNVITQAVLQGGFGAGLNNWLPLDPASYYWGNLNGIQGASLAVALVTIAYWAILALLALHAIARIVMVNLMLIVSPLAGLAIVTGSGWNYARVWLFRFVELLATPLIWGATLGFARALLSGFGADTHPILGPILAIFAMALVFRAPRLLGLAAQEAVTGARTLLRMAERAAFASVVASGAAGAVASAVAAGGEQAPTIYVDLRGAASGSPGTSRQEWDGPAFGAAATQAALPPSAAPTIIDQE